MIIHNQDAETCARALVNQVVSRFGAFATLHSDQGRNWESSIFQEVLNLLQIRRTRTSGLYPKGNPRFGRFIGSLTRHIAVVVNHQQTDWPCHIPLILLAYRTARHSSTLISPAELLYGRLLNLPADLARDPLPPPPRLPPPTRRILAGYVTPYGKSTMRRA